MYAQVLFYSLNLKGQQSLLDTSYNLYVATGSYF